MAQGRDLSGGDTGGDLELSDPRSETSLSPSSLYPYLTSPRGSGRGRGRGPKAALPEDTCSVPFFCFVNFLVISYMNQCI